MNVVDSRTSRAWRRPLLMERPEDGTAGRSPCGLGGRLKVRAHHRRVAARQVRRLLAKAKLHSHKYATDAVLAGIGRQQTIIFTSDLTTWELVPDSILLK